MLERNYRGSGSKGRSKPSHDERVARFKEVIADLRSVGIELQQIIEGDKQNILLDLYSSPKKKNKKTQDDIDVERATRHLLRHIKYHQSVINYYNPESSPTSVSIKEPSKRLETEEQLKAILKKLPKATVEDIDKRKNFKKLAKLEKVLREEAESLQRGNEKGTPYEGVTSNSTSASSLDSLKTERSEENPRTPLHVSKDHSTFSPSSRPKHSSQRPARNNDHSSDDDFLDIYGAATIRVLKKSPMKWIHDSNSLSTPQQVTSGNEEDMSAERVAPNSSSSYKSQDSRASYSSVDSNLLPSDIVTPRNHGYITTSDNLPLHTSAFHVEGLSPPSLSPYHESSLESNSTPPIHGVRFSRRSQAHTDNSPTSSVRMFSEHGDSSDESQSNSHSSVENYGDNESITSSGNRSYGAGFPSPLPCYRGTSDFRRNSDDLNSESELESDSAGENARSLPPPPPHNRTHHNYRVQHYEGRASLPNNTEMERQRLVVEDEQRQRQLLQERLNGEILQHNLQLRLAQEQINRQIEAQTEALERQQRLHDQAIERQRVERNEAIERLRREQERLHNEALRNAAFQREQLRIQLAKELAREQARSLAAQRLQDQQIQRQNQALVDAQNRQAQTEQSLRTSQLQIQNVHDSAINSVYREQVKSRKLPSDFDSLQEKTVQLQKSQIETEQKLKETTKAAQIIQERAEKQAAEQANKLKEQDRKIVELSKPAPSPAQNSEDAGHNKNTQETKQLPNTDKYLAASVITTSGSIGLVAFLAPAIAVSLPFLLIASVIIVPAMACLLYNFASKELDFQKEKVIDTKPSSNNWVSRAQEPKNRAK